MNIATFDMSYRSDSYVQRLLHTSRLSIKFSQHETVLLMLLYIYIKNNIQELMELFKN